jgi:type III secretion protein V
MSTLFRLALEISATRLILLDADAGEVIRAFGDFVVRGNLIVGLVIFLIIAMVQLIVIAKGAERTAEVTARFVNDSIPIRLQSIDLDLKTGAVTHDKARELRHEISLESQFFSRMTGAMNFVKGDAIGSLVIAAINLIGGLVSGLMIQEMSLTDALETYTILTIGSGLVSQIPAMIICVSAGTVMSLVSSEQDPAGFGTGAATQLLALPKAIAVSSFLLLGLGMVPGLPTIPFLLLGASGLFLSYRLTRPAGVIKDDTDTGGVTPGTPSGTTLVISGVKPLVPFIIYADPVFFEPAGGRILQNIENGINQQLNRLYMQFGVLYPAPHFISSEGMRNGGMVLQVHQLTAGQGVMAGKPESYIAQFVANVLRTHVKRFLTIQDVRNMVEQFRLTHPATVEEVWPSRISLTHLTDLLQRLAEEDVPLRDLPVIFGVLASRLPVLTPQLAGTLPDIPKLAEAVRAALLPNVLQLSGSTLIAPVHIDYALESRIEAGDSDAEAELRDAAGQVFGTWNAELDPVVLVRGPGARRKVWEVLSPLRGEPRFFRVMLHSEVRHILRRRPPVILSASSQAATQNA